MAETSNQIERCSRLPLYRSEILTLLGCLLTVSLYLFFEQRPRDPLNAYLTQLKALALFYPFGLFVAFIFLLIAEGYRQRKSKEKSAERVAFERFRSDYLNISNIWRDFRLFHVVVVMFVLFGHLKHLIPIVNSSLWDKTLLRFEEWMFGGRVAFEVLDQFLSRELAPLISHGYQAYYVYFSVVLFIFVLQRKARRVAEEYCFAFVLLWLLGTCAIYLMPTWGPCFYVPERFTRIPATEMQVMQASLWEMKKILDLRPDQPGVIFAISGIPSMHLAVVLLGTAYLHRLHWMLAVASWVFVLVTVLSTLYFGWHYVLDDVASFMLVGVVLICVRWVYRERHLPRFHRKKADGHSCSK